MAYYILVIGENIVDGNSNKTNLLPKYNIALKKYKISKLIWKDMPTIWKKDKSPEK